MTRRPVEFRPEARDEFVEASEYYRARSASAADRFEDAVRRLVSRIAAHPAQFAFVEPPVRLALTQGFPYYLAFREVGGKVEVLGVCHASRRPGYWKVRRQEPGTTGESPS